MVYLRLLAEVANAIFNNDFGLGEDADSDSENDYGNI